MAINKQNKNGKEVSITYENDNSINVNVFNNKILMGIAGSFDNNLKELERITETNIYSRGNSILVKSTPKKNEIVKNAIVFLFDQFINNWAIEKKILYLQLINL